MIGAAIKFGCRFVFLVGQKSRSIKLNPKFGVNLILLNFAKDSQADCRCFFGVCGGCR